MTLSRTTTAASLAILFTLLVQASADPPRDAGSAVWRRCSTVAASTKDNLIQTAINGVPVSEFDSSSLKPQPTETTGEGDPDCGPRPESGFLGLQNHDKNSVVFFKEVSVRPLASGAR